METICHKNGKVYTSDFLCHVSKSQNLLDNLLHFFCGICSRFVFMNNKEVKSLP